MDSLNADGVAFQHSLLHGKKALHLVDIHARVGSSAGDHRQ